MKHDFKFGWWTSGRDNAAVELLKTALHAMDQGRIRGRIAYCFLSRKEGEGPFSDAIIEIARKKEIPWVGFSAKTFEPELRVRDREKWRDLYHREVLRKIGAFDADLVILAGYMWVVSADACKKLNLLNLHPALPGGPQGTWQEVIWELIEKRQDATGAMMHLVTPELDKGPPVTYVSFSIKGKEWDALWNDFEERLQEAGTIEEVKKRWGEDLPLFKKIREEGVKRELPLITETMAAFSKGEITLSGLKKPVELKL